MKLKVFLISFFIIIICLFLSLNQEVYATSNDFTIDLSDTEITPFIRLDFNFYDYIVNDIVPSGQSWATTWYGGVISNFDINNYNKCVTFISNNGNYSSNYYTCYCLFFNDNSTITIDNKFTNGASVSSNYDWFFLTIQYYYDSNDILPHIVSHNSVSANTIYYYFGENNIAFKFPSDLAFSGDTSLTYTYIPTLLSTTYLSENGSSGGEGGSEGGGESGGDNGGESENIFDAISDFFGNFWDNIIHIIVPSSEDFSDLQESFNDNIVSIFSITSLSRTSDYSNNDKYPSINYNGTFPQINILGYDYDTEQIYNLLHTPISFGNLRYNMGDTISSTSVNTGGLTAYTLINIFIALEFAFLNIYLFNKFFDKGD